MKIKLLMLPGYMIVVLLFQVSVIFSQENGGIYLDPHRANTTMRRQLFLSSNQVESLIMNNGTFGQINNKTQSGAWPAGTGHGHVQQMSIIVSANVLGTNGQELHITSDSYEDFPDRGPKGEWYFWYPLPGYFNIHREYRNPITGKIERDQPIANAKDPSTFPDSWPGKDPSWNGKWNGYFGKDQTSSDQECMYVMDDSYNSEFPYYPFASDTTRKGLGLQVETRMFQWAHPLAKDEVFVHFQISNISDNVYDRNIYFGAFADTHPGGLGATDDNSGWSKADNFVFAWDNDNQSTVWTTSPEVLPGYLGWKYLESPGFSDDGIDNDADGLIDERRDNDAGQWVFGPVGNYGPEKWHWSGDEDGDWSRDIDDVGSDGLSPLDINYTGPDADGTEGNGRPDQGEPNFGKTDKDESDQIGLTSFYSPAWGSMQISDDEAIWQRIQPGVFETPAQNSNNMWVFASGPFKLERKQTERFSVCWLFGADRIDIFRNAQTAQKIYDNGYRFTKPPLTPTLKAVAGDKKVTLYWDDLAEKSLDPVYGKDFEGYKIIRGTNPFITEADKITNGYGSVVYTKPIAQFDLKDGIHGMHPAALGTELGEQYSTGVHYYMGEDTGLRHFYVDSSGLQNGVTYYYALISYDKGYYKGMDDRGLSPMTPAECAKNVTIDDNVITYMSPNIVQVIPNAPAVNYIPGSIENGVINQSDGSATGAITATIIDPDKLVEGSSYEINFDSKAGADKGIGVPFATSYSVKNLTTGNFEIQNAPIPFNVASLDSSKQASDLKEYEKYDTTWTSNIINGMALNFRNAVPNFLFIRTSSGWLPGSKTTSQVDIDYGDQNDPMLFPVSFKIEFTESPSGQAFTSKTATNTFDTYFKITDLKTGEVLPCYFKEGLFSKNGKWNKNEVLYVGTQKADGTYIFPWALTLNINSAEALEPAAGDVYQFLSPVPFTNKDKFTFKTTASKVIKPNDNTILNKIAVVPNPYVLAAPWERGSLSNGRGDRRISFIHLPAECTIKIFTQNGVLLRTIEHNGAIADGAEFWDLTTEQGLEVAFGIYVYYIDAKNLGQKTGTFAIIN